MHGLHLTADLYDCRCDRALLTDAILLGQACRTAVTGAGLTRVAERFHAFPHCDGQPSGVTGALLLAESHLAVHTWPERRGVTLDVYVCNLRADNSARAQRVMDELLAQFEASRQVLHRLERGDAEGLPSDHPEVADTGNGPLLLEWLNPYSAYGFRARERLALLRSPHQTIEVFDTPQFGKLFRLDGHYMTSERDEFFYHEPLVHCAALAHPAPRSALVIGGGDGGSTEELFKHPGIERVVMAELDQQVIDIARTHLQSVHRGALDDPRLSIRIGDGRQFVRHCTERFDLIVLDLTDPDGTPAEALYGEDFFRDVRRLLHPGGALSLHVGSPLYCPQRVGDVIANLRRVFAVVRPLGLYIPLYGSYWSMAVASDQLDPLRLDPPELQRRLQQRGIGDLDCYSAQMHAALFTLPPYFARLLQPAHRP